MKWLNKTDFSGTKKQLLPVRQKFSISKAYGLIKIHKAGFPVRPIISIVNSPTYYVSKFFAQFLQNNLKIPLSHIDKSLELKEKLENIKIPCNYEIVSFDVVSLFTNVPENT